MHLISHKILFPPKGGLDLPTFFASLLMSVHSWTLTGLTNQRLIEGPGEPAECPGDVMHIFISKKSNRGSLQLKGGLA